MTITEQTCLNKHNAYFINMRTFLFSNVSLAVGFQKNQTPPPTPLYLLMRCVPNSNVLSFVVDGVEGFVGLQAESGDGQKDEEE